MCDNWRKEHAKSVSCEGIVLDSGDGEFIVKGHVNSLTSNPTVIFWAPNPPTYCTSYTGSDYLTLMQILHMKIQSTEAL